jgi:hypothetical protein
LQIVAPWGDRLHSGVRVVEQLLEHGQTNSRGGNDGEAKSTHLQTCPTEAMSGAIVDCVVYDSSCGTEVASALSIIFPRGSEEAFKDVSVALRGSVGRWRMELFPPLEVSCVRMLPSLIPCE